MDRGAWRATVHGVAEFGTTERLTHTCMTYEIYKPFSHGPCNLIQWHIFIYISYYISACNFFLLKSALFHMVYFL